MSHRPVLLNEVIGYLNPREGDFIIDGTIDGGGHASEIVKKISPSGKLLGVDLDEELIERLRLKAESWKLKTATLIRGNYADLPEILRKVRRASQNSLDSGLRLTDGASESPKADGLLLDLGFSSEQVESSGRGFSFLKDELLIMTYDRNAEPVYRILEKLREKELADMIFRYGGERFSRRIAGAVKRNIKMKPIRTSGELREAIETAVPSGYRRGKIHPATRTFQALRIYGNDELGNLEKALKNLPEVLRKGGRAVIISFHSLEDRLVKNYFRKMESEGILKILTSKPIRPTSWEIARNPRSRSAKLRAAEVI